MKLYYDFHIHSCLSPCGDEDSTPNNIVNMALIKGLNVIALSDHNTGKNCPAAMAEGRKNGLVVLPAMELTTAEDIHILCLFEKYECLEMLETYIQKTRLRVKNKPEIFGRQRILDEKGKIDPAKLRPITFDSVNNAYLVLGEKVGNAFKDGLKLK